MPARECAPLRHRFAKRAQLRIPPPKWGWVIPPISIHAAHPKPRALPFSVGLAPFLPLEIKTPRMVSPKAPAKVVQPMSMLTLASFVQRSRERSKVETLVSPITASRIRVLKNTSTDASETGAQTNTGRHLFYFERLFDVERPQSVNKTPSDAMNGRRSRSSALHLPSLRSRVRIRSSRRSRFRLPRAASSPRRG